MKKFFAISSALLLAGTANAAYLYWQVDASDFKGTIDYVTGETITSDASYAMVWAFESPDGAPVALDAGGGSKIKIGTGNSVISLDQLGDATKYSFYIELLNTSGSSFEFAGKSETFTYAQLQAANYVDVGTSILPPTQVWHGGSYTATPEPTSAMLVMFGLGLLALKRKRV